MTADGRRYGETTQTLLMLAEEPGAVTYDGSWHAWGGEGERLSEAGRRALDEELLAVDDDGRVTLTADGRKVLDRLLDDPY